MSNLVPSRADAERNLGLPLFTMKRGAFSPASIATYIFSLHLSFKFGKLVDIESRYKESTISNLTQDDKPPKVPHPSNQPLRSTYSNCFSPQNQKQ